MSPQIFAVSSTDSLAKFLQITNQASLYNTKMQERVRIRSCLTSLWATRSLLTNICIETLLGRCAHNPGQNYATCYLSNMKFEELQAYAVGFPNSSHAPLKHKVTLWLLTNY